MLYHPELIIYLWLLPVSILIILPALFHSGCFLYQHTSRGKAALRPDTLKNSIARANERRKHPGIGVTGACAH